MAIESPEGPPVLKAGFVESQSAHYPPSNGFVTVLERVYTHTEKEIMPPPKTSPRTVLARNTTLLDQNYQSYGTVRTVIADDSQDSTVSSTSAVSRNPQSSSQTSNGSLISIPDTDTSLAGSFDATRIGTVEGVNMVRPGLLRGTSSTSEATSSEGSPKFGEASTYRKGSKRTASGAVKGSGSIENVRAVPVGAERKEFRAAELSAQLKTRLSYALFKVDNGLETRSIAELEALPLNRQNSILETPDMSKTSRRHSISSDQYMLSPISQGSPSQISTRILQSRINGSTRPLSSIYPSSSAAASHAYDHPSGFHHPSLAPAPPITSSKRRSTISRVPPPLSSLNHSSHSGRDLYHPPLTPTHGIQGIRNQAEQDAVDTLLFMSSPVNSGNMKWAGSAGSPFRAPRAEFEKSSDARSS